MFRCIDVKISHTVGVGIGVGLCRAELRRPSDENMISRAFVYGRRKRKEGEGIAFTELRQLDATQNKITSLLYLKNPTLSDNCQVEHMHLFIPG